MQTDGMEAGRQHGIYNFGALFQRCYTFNSKGRMRRVGQPVSQSVSQSMRHEFLLHIMKSKTSKFLITFLITYLIENLI